MRSPRVPARAAVGLLAAVLAPLLAVAPASAEDWSAGSRSFIDSTSASHAARAVKLDVVTRHDRTNRFGNASWLLDTAAARRGYEFSISVSGRKARLYGRTGRVSCDGLQTDRRAVGSYRLVVPRSCLADAEGAAPARVRVRVGVGWTVWKDGEAVSCEYQELPGRRGWSPWLSAAGRDRVTATPSTRTSASSATRTAPRPGC